jgi:hypothetical protein
MTGVQWEKLQTWQQMAPGRRVMIELDSRIPLFGSCDRLPTQTIIVTTYRDGVVSVPVSQEDIGEIDERLREKAVQTAQAAMENSAKLLDKFGAGKPAVVR